MQRRRPLDWRDRGRIALANAKRDFTAEHAETLVDEEGKGDLWSKQVRGRETRAQRWLWALAECPGDREALVNLE